MIEHFELLRMPVELGRVIGDNSCAYDRMTIVALCLHTAAGHAAWGYSEVQTHGTFTRDAFWIRPLPDLAELRSIFEEQWWPILRGRRLDELSELRRARRSAEPALDGAVRIALWDLQAQQAGAPLYRVFNPAAACNRKRAYGSLLDFPLSDGAAMDIAQSMLRKGITAFKVKVGAKEAQRDIHRLRLIQSVIGPQASLSGDANEAWDWATALQRLEQFNAAGIELEYIEDPLPRGDFSGLRELTRRTCTPVFGHDYLNTLEDMERLVDAGVGGIRTNGEFDYMLECIGLAKRHRLPVSVGNSQFEIDVHVAAAFDVVDRIEYSALGWNSLVEEPVEIDDGLAIAPGRPGHGMVLKAKTPESWSDGGAPNDAPPNL